MTENQSAKGVVPPDNVRDAVAALLREDEKGAVKRLELSAQTLARVAAGARVNRSTIGVIRLRLGLGEAS